VALAAALSVLAGACGSTTHGPSGATGATKPNGPTSTGPAATVTTVAPEERSQPRWEKLTTFKGSGPLTTETLDISARAVQWRVNWQCQSGVFLVLPARQSGAEQIRPLADVASCSGQQGRGFSTKTGLFNLKVTASAPWQIDVEQQVDTPLVQDPLPAMASPGARIVATGTVYGVDRSGKGVVKLYKFADGTGAVRLENFFVTPTADLQVRLSSPAAPKTTPEVAAAPFKNVAFLPATVGSMNFPLPADFDITPYHSLVIWCELTQNAFAAAALAP